MSSILHISDTPASVISMPSQASSLGCRKTSLPAGQGLRFRRRLAELTSATASRNA